MHNVESKNPRLHVILHNAIILKEKKKKNVPDM